MISLAPHSGSTLEIFRSGGFALAVIGGLLLIVRSLRWVLLPLSAMGSMPLTAYSAHLVSLVVLAGPGSWIADNRVWVASAVALLMTCTAWSALKGRGPLERVTAWAARRAGVPAAAAPAATTVPVATDPAARVPAAAASTAPTGSRPQDLRGSRPRA